MKIANKRMLFICPLFFSYHRDIEREFEKQGYRVTYVPDRPHGFLYRAALLLGKWATNIVESWYKQKLSKAVLKNNYDLFFLIKGEYVTAELLSALCCRNPKMQTIMYQWDSLANFNYLDFCCFFEKCYSFDRRDCDTHHELIYKPLFYTHEFNSDATKEKIQSDFFFCASLHSDRASICSKLYEYAKINGLKSDLRLFVPPIMYFRLKIRGEFLDSRLVRTRKLSRKQIAKLMACSKVVLDIHHDSQTGLTMRTIETLALGKKLITTNVYIKREPFYWPENVLVIDRFVDNWEIQVDSFLEVNPYFVNMDDYGISFWVRSFFDESRKTPLKMVPSTEDAG